MVSAAPGPISPTGAILARPPPWQVDFIEIDRMSMAGAAPGVTGGKLPALEAAGRRGGTNGSREDAPPGSPGK